MTSPKEPHVSIILSSSNSSSSSIAGGLSRIVFPTVGGGGGPGSGFSSLLFRSNNNYFDVEDPVATNWSGTALLSSDPNLITIFGDPVDGNLDMKSPSFVHGMAYNGNKIISVVEDGLAVKRIIYTNSDKPQAERSVDVTATVQAAYAGSGSVADQFSSPINISISEDGSRAILFTRDPDNFFSNSLLVTIDLNDTPTAATLIVTGIGFLGGPDFVSINSDGTKALVVDPTAGNNTVRAYILNGASISAEPNVTLGADATFTSPRVYYLNASDQFLVVLRKSIGANDNPHRFFLVDGSTLSVAANFADMNSMLGSTTSDFPALYGVSLEGGVLRTVGVIDGSGNYFIVQINCSNVDPASWTAISADTGISTGVLASTFFASINDEYGIYHINGSSASIRDPSLTEVDTWSVNIGTSTDRVNIIGM